MHTGTAAAADTAIARVRYTARASVCLESIKWPGGRQNSVVEDSIVHLIRYSRPR